MSDPYRNRDAVECGCETRLAGFVAGGEVIVVVGGRREKRGWAGRRLVEVVASHSHVREMNMIGRAKE